MINENEREARKSYLGASESPTVLGFNPFDSLSDLYLRKIGAVDSFAGNSSTEQGNVFEPLILHWAETELRAAFVPGAMMIHEDGVLSANPDSTIPEAGAVVEAKYTTIFEEWGENGTDQVPHRVNVQVHQQMYVAGEEYRVAWIPVLLAMPRRPELRLYCVRRDDELANMVAREGTLFMLEHVRKKIPPDNFNPSIEVLKRVRREPKKIIEVESRLLDQYVAATARAKDAAEQKEAAHMALLTALRDPGGGLDAEGGITPDGRSFSYLEQFRKAYEVKETSFRVLRIKK